MKTLLMTTSPNRPDNNRVPDMVAETRPRATDLPAIILKDCGRLVRHWLPVALLISGLSREALAQGTWATKTPMPTARWQSSAGLIGGQIYVAAGYNPAIGGHITQVEAYDPATDSWVSKNPQPFQQDNAATAVINGILYIAGGGDCCVAVASAYAYNPGGDSWTSLASLPQAEEFPAGAAISGLMYAAGVPNPFAATYSATLEVYDPSSGVWTAKTPMPTPRALPAACAINGIFYVVGGNDPNGNGLSTVEAYDPATDSWTTKASMPTPRTGLAVVELNGILYAIGGSPTWGDSVSYNTVEAYNPTMDVWTEQPSMPTARSGLKAVVANGSLYAIGGAANGAYPPALATVEAFTPSNALQITLQPSSQCVSSGSNAVFTVVATGTPPLLYQWQFNGTNLADTTDGHISGSTNAILIISQAETNDEGSYSVIVSDFSGWTNSLDAMLSLDCPPAIAAQSTNFSAPLGAETNLFVDASGAEPLFYQWQFEGTNLTDTANISGSDTDTLHFNSFDLTDPGSYLVIVSNAYGAVTSSVIVLSASILPQPPEITNQPVGQTVPVGGSATFTVGVTGLTPLYYQWQENGTNLGNGGEFSGATNAALTISPVSTRDGGSYSVIVSNLYGAVTSSVATLTMPVVTSSTNLVTDGDFESGPTLDPWWSVSGFYGGYPRVDVYPPYAHTGSNYADLAGTGFNSISQTLSTTPGGTYTVSCWVALQAGGYGTTLTIDFGSVNLTNAAPIPVESYTLYTFNVTATSSATLLTIGAGGGAPLHLDDVSVTAQVPEAPGIAVEPANEGVVSGSNACFGVTATGTPPLSYQWRKDGTNLADGGEISGATTATLAIAPASAADAGNYQVVVTNAFGSVTSTVAVLTVVPPYSFFNGLAACYQFDGNGLDSFTNHLDLTLFGSPSFAPGLFGWALDLHHNFNQYAQRLVDDAAFDFGTNDFTIQVWINLYSFGSYEQTFIEKFEGANGPGWTLTSPSGFQFYADNGALAVNGSANVTTGVWHQLVVLRSGNIFELFFDNTPISSVTSGVGLSTTLNGLLVGKRNSDDGRDFSVDGRLDEIAIWERALTANEMAALYNSGQGMQLIATPDFTSVGQTNHLLNLTCNSIAGLNYQLQYKTNLLQNNWISLGGTITATGPTLTVSDSPTNAQRFYRVVLYY